MLDKSDFSGDKLRNALRTLDLLSDTEINRVCDLSASKSISPVKSILTLGLVEEAILLESLAALQGLDFLAAIGAQDLDLQTLETLTLDWCRSKKLVPVTADGSSICIATADPTAQDLADELRFYLSQEIVLAVAPTQAIRSVLDQHSNASKAPDTAVSEDLKTKDRQTAEELDQDGPVRRFVAEIFETAIARGASDIHFEAQDDGLRVRLRVAGLLQPLPINTPTDAASVFARVKVLAAMNVSERRLPQDGRITQTIGGRVIDFRISSVPTSNGESIVCRVLDPKALRLGWEKLGFDPATTAQIQNILKQPSGLFLVTGPTGSGKTTTLYTALSDLNQMDRKIITIEDPIEYDLAGVQQVQVHEEIGMTFAVALRAFLRQDPNVIMIGEIRDQETAEIACRSALVGRLVLSTLHTNSAEGAKTRLIDLGVPEYIVDDVLSGVLGQRLEPTDGEVQLRCNLLDFEPGHSS